MSKVIAKASVDFQLLDNGTALATATPQDAAGLTTTLPAGTSTPVWTSSDPGVTVVPVATDSTGLTATVAPAVPPVLLTGAVITVSATLASGTAISGSGNPIDVVSGGASGFQVTEQ